MHQISYVADGIANELLKLNIVENAQPFLEVYNDCLHAAVFPWQKHNLLLRLVDHIAFRLSTGRSSLDAILQVKTLAEDAIKGTRWEHGHKKYYAAFNSSSSAHIIQRSSVIKLKKNSSTLDLLAWLTVDFRYAALAAVTSC
uniref:Uncharacterized protein n=1 Tax=Glossina morsitans morsitans TaxID=37546 RepID=A0A1B0FIW6_GLOMM